MDHNARQCSPSPLVPSAGLAKNTALQRRAVSTQGVAICRSLVKFKRKNTPHMVLIHIISKQEMHNS
jgi:hypothetical protein